LNDVAMVDLLLAKGAKVDLQDSEGTTALVLAAQRGRDEIAEALLEHGANVKLATNKHGWTALHCEIVICLIVLSSKPKHNSHYIISFYFSCCPTIFLFSRASGFADGSIYCGPKDRPVRWKRGIHGTAAFCS
jgi:Ankyrin repeats (3 copies)